MKAWFYELISALDIRKVPFWSVAPRIVDIELDGIDLRDYADYADSYISKASVRIFGHYRYLSNDEIEYINDKHSDWVYEKVLDYLF